MIPVTTLERSLRLQRDRVEESRRRLEDQLGEKGRARRRLEDLERDLDRLDAGSEPSDRLDPDLLEATATRRRWTALRLDQARQDLAGALASTRRFDQALAAEVARQERIALRIREERRELDRKAGEREAELVLTSWARRGSR